MKKAILVMVAALAFAVPVSASVKDLPLASIYRLAWGLRGSHQWYSAAGDEKVPTFGREFTVGAGGAYFLTKNLSAIGAVDYGLENRLFRSSVGLHLTIWNGMAHQ